MSSSPIDRYSGLRRRVWPTRLACSTAAVCVLAAGLVACGSDDKSQTSGAAGGGGAKKTYLIRLSASQGPGYPSVVASEYFGKEVEKLSDGRLKVQVFPSGQLAGAEGTAQGLQNGSIQMGYLSPSWVANTVPQASGFSLPYVFPTREAAYAAMDGKAGQDVAAALSQKAGIKVLGWWDANFGQFINNRHPITKVDDLHGLKMRIIAGPVTLATYKAWNAVPIPMDFAEVITGLRQGTVDGLDQPMPSIQSLKLNEASKYLSISDDTFYVEIAMINQKFFESLPADLQKIITDTAVKATEMQRQAAQKSNDESLAALKAAGMKVNTIAPADRESLKAALTPVYDSAAKDFGQDFVNALQSPSS